MIIQAYDYSKVKLHSLVSFVGNHAIDLLESSFFTALFMPHLCFIQTREISPPEEA
jgi:hypothetical protein